MTTRRKFLKDAGSFAALTGAKPFSILVQPQQWEPEDWKKEFPGNWAFQEEEKQLMQIPLDRDQAMALLRYKLNQSIFDNEKAVKELKDRKIWPAKDGISLPVNPGLKSGIGRVFSHGQPANAKDIMEIFYTHILDQYDKANEWDKHPNEVRTVGTVWRRFWEQASNRAYEEACKSHIMLLLAYPNGPATYCEADKKKIQEDMNSNARFLGESNVRMMQEYAATHIGDPHHLPHTDPEHLNNDNVPFAKITRGGPQLNFPEVMAQCHIDPSLLRISKKDLVGTSIIKTDHALTALPSSGRDRFG